MNLHTFNFSDFFFLTGVLGCKNVREGLNINLILKELFCLYMICTANVFTNIVSP